MKTAAGEVVEEVLVPAPGRVKAAVDEQQRSRMLAGRASLFDDLEHETPYRRYQK